MTENQVEHWRTAVLADAVGAQRALDKLDQTDHGRFVALCRDLANDSSDVVKQIAFRKLGQRGDRDDAIAEASAYKALQVPALQDTALFALGRVGTARAFPVLLTHAQNGSYIALAAAADQVRTDAEAEQLLVLAREYLLMPGSKGFQLRAHSVTILLRYSSATDERALLLEAARRYADDFVIKALSDSTADVLDDLRELRSTYPQDCVEYKALSRAIARLERRQTTPQE